MINEKQNFKTKVIDDKQYALKTKKYVVVTQNKVKQFGHNWYEIILIVLFFVGFIYVAYLQYKTIESNIAYISCRSARQTILAAITDYKTDFPNSTITHIKKNINLDKLIETKYLRYKPKCWCGGHFRLNSREEVYCTYHNPELEDIDE